ncbi:unnamed protein product [Ectocarpus sp. 6 AP-2014]
MPTKCRAPQCTRCASFNTEGGKTAMFCRQHAEEGMVDVAHKRCAQAGCTQHPTFNNQGSKTAMFCKQHAEEGMVDVAHKRCAEAGCTQQPTFNNQGSKTAMFCKQHAEEGMVDVLNKCCSHGEGCTSRPGWGYWADGKASVCAKHKGDLTEGFAISFTQRCTVAGVKGCRAVARWGVEGEQPTHCEKHGVPRAGEGFVRVPSSGRRTSASSSRSSTASGRRHSAGGGRTRTRGGGGIKRARKAVPRRPVESWSEEESDEDSDDDDSDGSVGDADEEEEDENEGQEKVEKPKRKIIWL